MRTLISNIIASIKHNLYKNKIIKLVSIIFYGYFIYLEFANLTFFKNIIGMVNLFFIYLFIFFISILIVITSNFYDNWDKQTRYLLGINDFSIFLTTGIIHLLQLMVFTAPVLIILCQLHLYYIYIIVGETFIVLYLRLNPIGFILTFLVTFLNCIILTLFPSFEIICFSLIIENIVMYILMFIIKKRSKKENFVKWKKSWKYKPKTMIGESIMYILRRDHSQIWLSLFAIISVLLVIVPTQMQGIIVSQKNLNMMLLMTQSSDRTHNVSTMPLTALLLVQFFIVVVVFIKVSSIGFEKSIYTQNINRKVHQHYLIFLLGFFVLNVATLFNGLSSGISVETNITTIILSMLFVCISVVIGFYREKKSFINLLMSLLIIQILPHNLSMLSIIVYVVMFLIITLLVWNKLFREKKSEVYFWKNGGNYIDK